MRALVLLLLVLLGCDSKPKATAGTNANPANPGETAPAFDTATASAMLTRTLQAQERNDPLAVQNDLFPRAPHTLNACAKSRLAYSRAASLIPEEGGEPSRVTGVTLGSPRAMGGAYQVDYKAV